MALIEVDDVTFTYSTQPDDETALQDVSYGIEDGTFVGITGKSGAGKATFCRLVAGQIPHFYQGDLTGSVTIDGTPTTEQTLDELSSTIGFVFENPYDQLTGSTTTVLEEVAFGLETMGLEQDAIRERAETALEKIGIKDLADRHPQQLSGGQCQRVAIASVLAMQPDILILQQPTAQLDPDGTEEVFDVVAEMNEEGYTIIMVSQDLTRLSPYLDELLVFDDGSICLDGPPRDVLTKAEKQNLPLLVPPPVRIGHRLREEGYINSETPIPLTISQCVAELDSLIDEDKQPGLQVASHSGPQSASDTSSGQATENDERIVLDDLHHTYPSGVQALEGISFSLDEGCICIIGQNGAGKSTLVKHLNGLLKPTKGRVLVDGLETTDRRVAELAEDVGLSFQNPDDQLFHNTVEEEIRYGPQNLGYDEERTNELVDSAIETFNLDEEREKNPYDLVIPWRKRAAVASVAAMDTPTVILDEPTSGQDAPGHDVLGDFVDKLSQKRRLVIVITHDMHFVNEHADRVIVLSQSNLLMDGPPREVLADVDTLAQADVEPPAITRIGLELGLSEPVLSIDELSFER